MSSTRVQRKGPKTVVYMGGQPGAASGSAVSNGGQCTSRGSVYRVPGAENEPKIVRVVPKGTTILLEEVKADADKSPSGRSRSRLGGAGYAAPRRPEPGPAEHCIECLAELVQRRRTQRMINQGARKSKRLVASLATDFSGPAGRAPGACCPTCGRPPAGSMMY